MKISLVAIVITISAWAQIPGIPYVLECANSYNQDSFYFGVKKSFTNQSTTMVFENTYCLQRGESFGNEVSDSQRNPTMCRSNFLRGVSEGRRYAAAVSNSDQCFSLGVMAGRAEIHNATRAGQSSVAGSRCVSAYRKGVSDGQNNRVPTISAGMSFKDQNCYQLGRYEFTLY